MRKLYIRQKVFKLTDHYPITDDAGNTVYKVDQNFRWIGFHVELSRPDGSRIFTIERELLTLLPRFNVTFADGRVLTFKKEFTFFKMAIDILPHDFGLSIRGKFWAHDFDLLLGNEVIGHIEKAYLTFGDVYELTVFDPAYEEVLIASMITVDAILDAAQQNNH